MRGIEGHEMEGRALRFLSGLGVLGPRREPRGRSSGLVHSRSTFEKDVNEVPVRGTFFFFFSPRFDSEGQALDGVSISDLRSGGAGGSNTNWKTLYEAKSENLGQGDKVPCTPRSQGPENDTWSLVPVQSCALTWDLSGTAFQSWLVWRLCLLRDVMKPLV